MNTNNKISSSDFRNTKMSHAAINLPPNDPKCNMARVLYRDLDDENSNYLKSTIKQRKRKIGNILSKIVPWGRSLKRIESSYGSGFASLFEFIRWLMIFNFIIAILIAVFIILPEFVYDRNKTDDVLSSIGEFSDVCSKDTQSLSTKSDLFTNNYADLTTEDTDLKETIEETIKFTKCCSFKYDEYIENKTSKNELLDDILDILQGTGNFEKNFFFYGHYSNKSSLNADENYNYYMGLSFSVLTIISLVISSLFMLCRLGSGAKESIVEQMDSVSMIKFTNQAFCVWDYHIRDPFAIQFFQSSNFRFFKNQIEDLKYNEQMSAMGSCRKIMLYVGRFLANLITLAMFGGAGYGFYTLNEFALKKRNDIKDQLNFQYGDTIVDTIIDYLPAITLNIINIVFRFVFEKMQLIENYKNSRAITLLLLRIGFARIGSLLFLVITMALNVINNENECASQKNELLNTFQSNTEFSFTKKQTDLWCWETYIGQEFYKLIIVDFILQFIMFILEALRKIMSKMCGKKFAAEFDLEGKFLDLLNSQNIFWLGTYFSPFLGVFAPVYYFFKFYLNKISLKYFCELPNKKQSQSKINTSFFIVLFAIFLLVLVIFGFLFTVTRPSRSCGPFRLQFKDDFNILYELTNQLEISLPAWLKGVIDFVFSSFFLIIVSLVMIALIWLFFSIANSQKLLSSELRKIINEEQKRVTFLATRKKKIEEQLSKDEIDIDDLREDDFEEEIVL